MSWQRQAQSKSENESDDIGEVHIGAIQENTENSSTHRRSPHDASAAFSTAKYSKTASSFFLYALAPLFLRDSF